MVVPFLHPNMIFQSNGKVQYQSQIKLGLENNKTKQENSSSRKYRPRRLYEIQPRRNGGVSGGRGDLQSVIAKEYSQQKLPEGNVLILSFVQ